MTDLSDLVRTRYGIETGIGRDAPEGGALATILGRRSYRRFRDEPVPAETVDLLLACAQSAPSKSDLQQYAIIVVEDAADKARLAEISDNGWLASAPVVLVFCGDLRRAQRLAALRSKTYGQNTLDSFMNAAVDAALAMETFILAAESIGLGCCAVSHVRNDLDAVGELLSLPDGVFPLAGLGAGWPGETRDASMRLPPSIVVHRGRYDDTALSSEVDAYDRRRSALHPIRPNRQLHADRYGTAAFYGWSENAARRLSMPEGLEKLRGYLQQHGFDLA